MTAPVRLRDLPLVPDPEWFGWPGARRGERARHAYASGTVGSPSLCGRQRLYEHPGAFGTRTPICGDCAARWTLQYPPRGLGGLS